MDSAPTASLLLRPVILDNCTRIDRILISRLQHGWLVVDQDMHQTVFLPCPYKEPLEVIDDVKRVVFEYNMHAEGQPNSGTITWNKHYNPSKIDATRWALFYYLLRLKKRVTPPLKLPRQIDVEPFRLGLIKNQRERDRVEREAKEEFEKQKRRHRKRRKIVVIIDDD